MDLLAQIGQIVTVKTVPKEPLPPPASVWDQLVALIPIAIILIVLVLVVVFVIMLVMKKRSIRKDVFKSDYLNTIQMCKIHRNRKYLSPYFGIPMALLSKGAPIIVRYPDVKPHRIIEDSEKKEKDKKKGKDNKDIEKVGEELEAKEVVTVKRGESYKLGNYRGHCVTHDGHTNVMFASAKDKILMLFPKTYVIKLRQGVKKRVIDSDDRDSDSMKTKTIDVPADSFDMSGDYIFIDCFSLQKIGEYLYPVNVDKDGRVVDNRAYVYYDLIDIATQKQLIDFGKNMVNATDEIIRINPNVQYSRKVETEGIRGAGT